MNWIKHITLFCLAAIAVSCGSSDSLEITVDIDGLGTQNVNLSYYTRSGFKTVSIPVIDGHLEYSYVSEETLLIEFTTANGRLIGHVVAKNGEKITAKFKLGDSSASSVKGNAVAKRLAEFCAANAAVIDSLDLEGLNQAIAKYVEAHPDDQVSTILMSRYYDATLDPDRAAELLSGIAAAARPASLAAGASELYNVGPDTVSLMPELSLYNKGDSLSKFAPKDSLGLLLAINAYDAAISRDSTVRMLNAIADSLKGYAQVVELLCAPDTAAWHALALEAKATYPVTWLPLGLASPAIRELNIKSLPTIVVADSCSNIVYQGASFDEAASYFNSKP
ncbi:MAG: hypothetical protein HDS75_04725 [Bacteroidales bacterium]|nr:hypothetical protein [Bacteroidales bacterium]